MSCKSHLLVLVFSVFLLFYQNIILEASCHEFIMEQIFVLIRILCGHFIPHKIILLSLNWEKRGSKRSNFSSQSGESITSFPWNNFFLILAIALLVKTSQVLIECWERAEIIYLRSEPERWNEDWRLQTCGRIQRHTIAFLPLTEPMTVQKNRL